MIAILLALVTSWAAETPSLDGVLSSADRHLPVIVAAEAEAEAAVGARLAAQGGFDPSLDVKGWWRTGPYEEQVVDARLTAPTPLWGLELQAGYRIGVGSFAVYDGKLETLGRGEVFGSARLPLLKGGFYDPARLDIAVARADVSMTDAKLAMKRIEVAEKARVAWWDWVAAGERLEVAQTMLAVAGRTREAIQIRVSRGDAPEIDLVDNRRILLEREAQVVKAEVALQAAAYKLGLYLRDGAGEPDPPVGVAPPPLPAPSVVPEAAVDQAVADAFRRRPDALALSAKREAVAAKLKLAKVEVLPKLDLLVDLAQDLGTPSDKTEPFDVQVGGALSVPLLQRPGRGKLTSARAEVGVVDAEVAWLRDRIDADVRSAWAYVVAAGRQAELVGERLALTRQMEAATRRRQALGDADLFDVYLREQSTMSAAMSRIDAWAAVQVADARWRAARGTR